MCFFKMEHFSRVDEENYCSVCISESTAIEAVLGTVAENWSGQQK